MPLAFPWEIRGESAEEEVKRLRKRVKEQEEIIKELEIKCVSYRIKDTKKRY